MSWLQALAAALLFGASTPLSKQLLQQAHPFMLASLFYLGAALILLPTTVYYQVKAPLRQISRTDFFHLLGSLFFGGMVGPVLLLYGLQYTAATTTALLLNLETPATAILAFWLFRENISRKAAAANVGIVAAGVILSFQGELLPGIGGVLIALACVAWGLDNNFTASIIGIDAVRTTFLKGLIFGTVNLLIAAAMVKTWPSVQVVLTALVIGAFSYGISIALYISSARKLGAARSQMAFAAAPFFGVAVSQIYLGESFYLYQVISTVILVAMLAILFTETHYHYHEHPPVRHEHPHRHEDEHHDHDEAHLPAGVEHSHLHTHRRLYHRHAHMPDPHHRHKH
jgi:drug/metabolite transporter (DMT)-like permease